MHGQTVARMLLVITLIVTAHTIKPFSVKNITSHLLYSSRSLAVILPDSLRSSFNHTNQLALTLSNSIFSDVQPGPRWSKKTAADSGSIALDHKQLVDIPSYEIGSAAKTTGGSLKPGLIANPVGDQSIEETDSISLEEAIETRIADEAASTAAAEVASEPSPVAWPAPHVFPSAIPIALPVLRITKECVLRKRIQPIRIEMFRILPQRMPMIYEPKRPGCDPPPGKQVKLIAFLEETRERLKSNRVRVEQSIFTMLECEEQEAEATAEDYAAELLEQASTAHEFDGLSIPGMHQRNDNCAFP
jgi:hypothetical protein